MTYIFDGFDGVASETVILCVFTETVILQIRLISNLAKILSVSGVWQVPTLGPFHRQAKFKKKPNLVSTPKVKAQVLRTRLERVVGDPEPHLETVHLL